MVIVIIIVIVLKDNKTKIVIDADSSDDGIKIESGEDLSHCEDDDFELDLNKYFIASNGSNFCDILLDIKNELVK